MKYAFTLVVCTLFGISESGFSQTVFKCVDASGTIIFSDSSCAPDSEQLYIQDRQSGILSSEPNYTEYQSGAAYSASPTQSTITPNTGSSSPQYQDKKAISQLKTEAMERCGSEYWGQSESDLQRATSILKMQSPSEETRREWAEINCHLKYLEKIRRIEFGGLEYALEYDLRKASEITESRSDTTSRPIAPQWLHDPFTGKTMPRTGAGYTDPATGTFYHDTGAGVVNTKTGEFTPTHQ